MNADVGYDDLLEAWKAAYNETGSGSVETLTQLAGMSRWIAGYKERSLDAHLALFGLTGEIAVLFMAIQIADALPDSPEINPAELALRRALKATATPRRPSRAITSRSEGSTGCRSPPTRSCGRPTPTATRPICI
jgi:hypothetical protein